MSRDTGRSARHCIFVFVDGVGLGPASETRNPVGWKRHAGLRALSGGQRWTDRAVPVGQPTHTFRPIDATLSLPGLPQSGTGQATLFTGVDCIEKAGRHFGPFPHSKTRPTLSTQNIFHKIASAGPAEARGVAFANAYPDIFFERMNRRRRWTVTTFCCNAAGVRLRRSEDLARNEAVSAALTRERWNTVGMHVPVIDPATAAGHLYQLSQTVSFTLFEFFLTDKAGHAQDPGWAGDILEMLDAFFLSLHEQIDHEKDLLVVTSDHGNLEDLSTKTHTFHPVPLAAVGAGAWAFRPVESIAGVVPAILRAFDPGNGSERE